MKKCISCGADNKNENMFCSTCGSREFGEPFSADDEVKPPFPADMAPEPPMHMPPPPVRPMLPMSPRKPFGIFDVLTILGFVSSIVGLWCIWVVLEPLAVAASLVGFFKGSRYKGLAASGIVISVIAFIIILFFTLYDGNIIGKWAVEGALTR